jgi:hypothetical protein
MNLGTERMVDEDGVERRKRPIFILSYRGIYWWHR